MIDMHAHWRPAELIDAMRARTKEPRIVRNQDGVEVVKSRIGEEPVSKAFDDVGIPSRQDGSPGREHQCVVAARCLLLDRVAAGRGVAAAVQEWSTMHCQGFARNTRGASVPLPRCRSWICLPPPPSWSARWRCRAWSARKCRATAFSRRKTPRTCARCWRWRTGTMRSCSFTTVRGPATRFPR